MDGGWARDEGEGGGRRAGIRGRTLEHRTVCIHGDTGEDCTERMGTGWSVDRVALRGRKMDMVPAAAEADDAHVRAARHAGLYARDERIHGPR